MPSCENRACGRDAVVVLEVFIHAFGGKISDEVFVCGTHLGEYLVIYEWEKIREIPPQERSDGDK